MESYSSLLNKLLVLVIIVAIVFLAREVLLPVTLAGILSFMLAPLVRMLQRLSLATRTCRCFCRSIGLRSDLCAWHSHGT